MLSALTSLHLEFGQHMVWTNDPAHMGPMRRLTVLRELIGLRVLRLDVNPVAFFVHVSERIQPTWMTNALTSLTNLESLQCTLFSGESLPMLLGLRTLTFLDLVHTNPTEIRDFMCLRTLPRLRRIRARQISDTVRPISRADDDSFSAHDLWQCLEHPV